MTNEELVDVYTTKQHQIYANRMVGDREKTEELVIEAKTLRAELLRRLNKEEK